MSTDYNYFNTYNYQIKYSLKLSAVFFTRQLAGLCSAKRQKTSKTSAAVSSCPTLV